VMVALISTIVVRSAGGRVFGQGVCANKIEGMVKIR
jgi:hypothetical protein